MRKAIAVTMFVLILAAAGTTLAGELKPAAYVGGGLNVPMAPETFTDFWKMGFGGTARFGLEIAPPIELGASFSYNNFPFDGDKLLAYAERISGEDLPADAAVDGASMTALEFLADVKYVFGAGEVANPFAPYMMALLGMTSVSFEDITVTAADSSATLDLSDVGETDFTIGFGAGFQYMFSPTVGFWLDGKYMVILTEGESTSHLPIRAGIKFLFGAE